MKSTKIICLFCAALALLLLGILDAMDIIRMTGSFLIPEFSLVSLVMLEAQSGSNKTEIGKLNCLLRAIVFLVLALGIFAMVIVDIGDAANMFLMIAASVVLVISGVMIMIKSLRGKG